MTGYDANWVSSLLQDRSEFVVPIYKRFWHGEWDGSTRRWFNCGSPRIAPHRGGCPSQEASDRSRNVEGLARGAFHSQSRKPRGA